MNPPNTRSPTPPPDAERYQSLVANITDYAIVMLDVQGQVMSWNAGAERLTGYRADEIIGSHFSRFYPEEALSRHLPHTELEVAAITGRFEDEGLRARKDGSTFWANVVIARMLDETGQLIGFSKVTRDLTDRREQEQILRHSEERFRLLVKGVKDYAIFMLDPDGYVATWNDGAEHIKGYRAEEIIGLHFSRFYPPEAIKRHLPETELRGATLEGRYEDEGWRVRKDGSRFWANVIITAIRNAAGELIGFAKVTRDLTERRRHEEELRDSEERFRLLVDGVTEYAIMMLDAEGFVTSWNSGAERIKGYRSSEILGKHVSHFYPSEDIIANKPWHDLAIARDEGRLAGEMWRVRKDGTLFWANTVVTALKDAEGNLRGFAKVTQDLTERRHAEALAETAQRMQEFIAMLAHELRNPLAPIRNAVSILGSSAISDPLRESMRQIIDRQSRQLTRLLDELLDVNRIARGQFTIEHEPVDMRDAVGRAVESSRPLIESRGHTLEIAMPDHPILVLGDSVRLTQAVVNLLNNAAKYTPDGGRIVLSTGLRKGEVELRVTDTGKGIDRAMLEKIFDLFVQLEPGANETLGGLGVGLALVRRVAELHGGSVQARSQGPGHGAEFIVRLPLAVDQGATPVETVQEPGAPVRQLRVLVVDDNKDAVETLDLLLQSMGQLVAVVYDGPSALAVAQSFRPDLVLLDIGMPHMSGYEVARALRSARLETQPMLVAITGWGQSTDKERAEEAGFQHHFVKPMSEEALRDILAEAAG